jgi:MoxR-like ATPase
MLEMMDVARAAYVAPALRHYIVSIADATRHLPELSLGVSPRGSIALESAARVRAMSQARPYVTPDDIKLLTEPVLAHRMLLRPEAELAGADSAKLLKSVLAAVPVPQDRVEAA